MMIMGQRAIQSKKTEIKKDISKTYNEFKKFEGMQYTGMKIGRGHKWYYDEGEYIYTVNKRRAGQAPEGSGVPVGTEYHWYILAHQNVRKLDANNYTTSMVGLKYKLAHKRADKVKWNETDSIQKKRLIQVLQELTVQLKSEMNETTEEISK